jgi:hypothetical protein
MKPTIALAVLLTVTAGCPKDDPLDLGAGGSGPAGSGGSGPAGSGGSGPAGSGGSPDASSGPTCQTAADCHLVDDYCTGCDCRALPKGVNPTCPGPGVQCMRAPCGGLVAACESGQCVARPAEAAATRWYFGCGDPACHGHTTRPGVNACTTEKVGAACAPAGAQCDPNDECNRALVCAASDPTSGAGGCPRSRRALKRDIHYLTPEELGRYHDELLKLKLATWRYRQDPARERLGFIIDDLDARTGEVAVDAGGELVDLYGYASLAVATLQDQAREIAQLRKELEDLKRQLARRR